MSELDDLFREQDARMRELAAQLEPVLRQEGDYPPYMGWWFSALRRLSESITCSLDDDE